MSDIKCANCGQQPPDEAKHLFHRNGAVKACYALKIDEAPDPRIEQKYDAMMKFRDDVARDVIRELVKGGMIHANDTVAEWAATIADTAYLVANAALAARHALTLQAPSGTRPPEVINLKEPTGTLIR